MRKRTITYICHSIFWNFLAFLPMFVVFFSILSKFMWANSFIRFEVFVPPFIDYIRSSFIYSAINNFCKSFSFGFMLDTTHNYFLPLSISWLVFIEIFHLFFDFIFFLPKILHKWIRGKLIK